MRDDETDWLRWAPRERVTEKLPVAEEVYGVFCEKCDEWFPDALCEEGFVCWQCRNYR